MFIFVDLEVVYMNSDCVSIPNDTSNSIRVYMGDWVEDWKITANKNLIPDWNPSQIHVPTSYSSGDFSTYTLIYVNKAAILQKIFISAIMNVDFIPSFIPSFIQEWNFDPSLHDS